MAKDIILDCDPGQDDALAILLALGSTELNLRAITVVGGNADVNRCYTNAIKVLALAERLDIPVYKGAQKPLKQRLVTLENVFGESGLAGSESWPVPPFSIPKETATDFLVRTYIQTNDHPYLVATAPQTNIALALQKAPSIAYNIPGLTMMGGCVFPEPIHKRMGNITFDGGCSYAEYNFATDPEAADIVLTSGIAPINLIGLEVTRTVLYNEKIDQQLRKIGSFRAKAVADMLSIIGEDDKQDYASVKQNPTDPVRAIHDAVAMCYVVDSSIFTTEQIPLQIALKDKRGQSLIVPTGTPVNVITSVNQKAFFDRVCSAIARLR